MYRLATKCTTKNESQPKSQYSYTVTAFLSRAASRHSATADSEACAETADCSQCSARAEVCGLRICGHRSAGIIVNWIRGLTANGFFIQRSRCCAHNE